MKLLFVHQNLGEFGGAETNIHLAAAELKRRGHEPALLYRHNTGRDEAAWRELFSPCFRLPAPGHVETAEAVLEQFAPDAVYLHNLDDLDVVETLVDSPYPVVRMVHDHGLCCMRGYKYNYFTRRPCERAASPLCVFPCLASVVRNPAGPLPLKWASYAEKKRELQLNRRCRQLVTYSEHMKSELVANGFEPERIELCVPMRMRAADEPTSSFSERNLILFAGQIIRGKGVDVLLEALAQVRSRFECVILGDGSHRAYCERRCRALNLADRVQFRGYVLPAEVKEFYLEASVFAMSSLWPEPFGMAGPEAMRYGLPVVAFDAGGIREWLRDGENGFLVPWRDSAGFAARLDEVLSNKELARRLGRAGQQWVQRYDCAAQIDRLENVFRRALSSQCSGSVPASVAETSSLQL